MNTVTSLSQSRIVGAALAGIAIGILGGLIGLGGAEFRLPVLIALFGFAALQAIILNKAMSLVVVTSALFFRMGTVAMDGDCGQLAHYRQPVGGQFIWCLAGRWLGDAPE